MIFYLVNVDYERQTGEDNPGKVKESYLVKASNCAEAERIVLNAIKPFVYGDCETPQIKRVRFFDVFENGKQFWYKAKVEMITVDGDKETRMSVPVLIAGDTALGAVIDLEDALGEYDHEVVSIQKTNIIEILKPEE